MQREDGFFDLLMSGSSASAGAAIQAALRGASPGFAATDEWLERQYGNGGVCARVVDLAAEDSWSRGFTIEGDDNDWIADQLEALQIDINGPTVSKWQSLYGGGALVCFIQDGSSTFKNPVNEGSIEAVTEIIPVEATSLSVFQYYDNPSDIKYGKPMIYQVKIQGFDNVRRTGTPGFGKATAQFLVHETRVIPFPGTPLPLNLRMAKRIPWQGRSDLGAVFEDFQRMVDSLKWSIEVLKRKQQAIHKYSGLSDLLQNDYNGNNEATIKKQLSMADAVRNLLNAVTIDADDDYTVQDLSVMGLVDLIKEFKEMFAASAGYPVSVLFGRAVTGLSANGDNDLEGYYGMIGKRQKTRVLPGLVLLITLLLKIRNAPKISKWKVEFNALWVPSEKDQAQAELYEGQGHQAEATAVSTLVGDSVISAAQATNYFVDMGMFGLTEKDRITDKDLLDPNSDVNNPPEPAPIVMPAGAQPPAGANPNLVPK